MKKFATNHYKSTTDRWGKSPERRAKSTDRRGNSDARRGKSDSGSDWHSSTNHNRAMNFNRKPTIGNGPDSSWQNVAKWYNHAVGAEGHHYHQAVVFPNLLKHFQKDRQHRVLDLACGQGVLSHYLPKNVEYVGVDLAEKLISYAEKNALKLSPTDSTFIQADATKKLNLKPDYFDLATIILAIQNVKNPEAMIKNAATHLHSIGELIIVMNHPCFRIPRQSAWGIDTTTKLQYRRINRYLSPMDIPIEMNPGQSAPVGRGRGRNQVAPKLMTHSFHYPLEYYFKALQKAGLFVETVEEWTSDKISEGKNKKMEDRARSEFPLFLMIKARKP